MDVQIKPLKEKSQVEINISVTAEELEPYLDQAAKKLSKDHPIKGFRPGKVPLSVAVQSYGADRLVSQALEYGVPRWFVQAVLENNIDALGRPATAINKASLEEGINFTATVDVLPPVKLGDPKTITVEKRNIQVSDQEVDQELTMLAKSRGKYIDVARPAQEGDTVIIDFEVSMNGVPMEGGSSKNHPVHLGEGHFIPDFETKLQGLQAGDSREFTMVFPDDFAQEHLRGQQATAKVKAHEIKKRIVPDLTDDFAKSLGQFTSLDDLKKQLRENMLKEKQHKEQDRIHGELTEKLADISEFDPLPESLIEREIDRRLQELMQMLAYQKKTIEDYLHQHKKTPAQLREELRQPAIRTVKVSLALRQFAQDHSIEVDDKEVEEESNKYLRQFKDLEQAKQQIDEDELRNHIHSTIRNRRALEKLSEIATVQAEKTAAAKS